MQPSKLKVDELRKELKRRGASTTGNKAALVQRLQELLDTELPSSVPQPATAATPRRPAALAVTASQPATTASPSATVGSRAAAVLASPSPPPAGDPGASSGILEEEELLEEHVDPSDFADQMPAVPAVGGDGGQVKGGQVRFAGVGGGEGEGTNETGGSDLIARGSPVRGHASAPAAASKAATTPADRAVRFGITPANSSSGDGATKGNGATSAAAAPVDPAEEEKRRKRARKFELGEKSAKELAAEEMAAASASRKRLKPDTPVTPVGAAAVADDATASAIAKAVAAPVAAAAAGPAGPGRKLAPPVPLDEVELAKRALRAKRFSCN